MNFGNVPQQPAINPNPASPPPPSAPPAGVTPGGITPPPAQVQPPNPMPAPAPNPAPMSMPKPAMPAPKPLGPSISTPPIGGKPLGAPTGPKPNKPPGPGMTPPAQIKLPDNKAPKEQNSFMPILISILVSLLLAAGLIYAGYAFFLKMEIDDVNTKIDNVQDEVNVLENRINNNADSTTTDSDDEATAANDDLETTTNGEKETLSTLFADVTTWQTEDPAAATPTTTCDDEQGISPTSSVFALTYSPTDDAELATVHQAVLDVIQTNGWTLCTTESPDAYPTGTALNQIYVKDSKLLFYDVTNADAAGDMVKLHFEYSE